jgi:hypothetical protein
MSPQKEKGKKGKEMREGITYMKFRLVPPILAPERHELLLRVVQQLRIEQCLERMVKYTSDLSRCRAQLFQNRDVVQECNHGRHQHPVRRDEWFERAERMDVRRAQRKSNFLVRFPELYIINTKRISLQSSLPSRRIAIKS